MDRLQELHEAGFNFSITAGYGGTFDVILPYLPCEWSRVYVTLSGMTFAEAVDWLCAEAARRYPDSLYARQQRCDPGHDTGGRAPIVGQSVSLRLAGM